MKKVLLALLLSAAPAWAADMSAKPVPFAALARATCTVQRCIGWHAGFDVMNSGTGVNILNLGTLNANGTLLGLEAGYQYYDGTYWLGARAMGLYNVAGAGNVGTLNNFFAFEGVELGGNLFAQFGLAPPQVTGFLATLTTAVPTAQIGACQHGKATGYCAGAAVHYFLPNTPIELKMEYINAQYGTTTVLPGQTISSENLVLFGANYHF